MMGWMKGLTLAGVLIALTVGCGAGDDTPEAGSKAPAAAQDNAAPGAKTEAVSGNIQGRRPAPGTNLGNGSVSGAPAQRPATEQPHEARENVSGSIAPGPAATPAESDPEPAAGDIDESAAPQDSSMLDDAGMDARGDASAEAIEAAEMDNWAENHDVSTSDTARADDSGAGEAADAAPSVADYSLRSPSDLYLVGVMYGPGDRRRACLRQSTGDGASRCFHEAGETIGEYELVEIHPNHVVVSKGNERMLVALNNPIAHATSRRQSRPSARQQAPSNGWGNEQQAQAPPRQNVSSSLGQPNSRTPVVQRGPVASPAGPVRGPVTAPDRKQAADRSDATGRASATRAVTGNAWQAAIQNASNPTQPTTTVAPTTGQSPTDGSNGSGSPQPPDSNVPQPPGTGNGTGQPGTGNNPSPQPGSPVPNNPPGGVISGITQPTNPVPAPNPGGLSGVLQ